jgi:hypothetical protein
MSKTIYKFKNIPGVKSGFENRFAQHIEGMRILRQYQSTAKHSWLDTKHRAVSTALKEFIRDYKPTSYLMIYQEQTPFWKDDSIEIWYMEE